LVLLAFAVPAAAQDLPAVPALTAHVVDQTGTLNADEAAALDAKLADFEKARGTQIVVLMVATTGPEDIAAYAQRVGDAWKIGRQDIGDGLLVVVAKNDRKVRIATTKALEGAIPDLAAKDIIDTEITPRFKKGDFAGGLEGAADQLMARITGENLAVPEADPETGSGFSRGIAGFDWEDLAIFLFFVVPIVIRLLSGLLGRKLGVLVSGGVMGALAWFFTYSLILTGVAVVLAVVVALLTSLSKFAPGAGGGSGWSSSSSGSSYGGSSSSDSSSSGGGFSSGGGGDFGGGGASGDW
jgi:uncharacterized protein